MWGGGGNWLNTFKNIKIKRSRYFMIFHTEEPTSIYIYICVNMQYAYFLLETLSLKTFLIETAMIYIF